MSAVAENILAEVEELSDEDLRIEFEKIQAVKERQRAYNKNHRQTMTDEQKEAQKARNRARYDRQKAILVRAEAAGLTE